MYFFCKGFTTAIFRGGVIHQSVMMYLWSAALMEWKTFFKKLVGRVVHMWMSWYCVLYGLFRSLIVDRSFGPDPLTLHMIVPSTELLTAGLMYFVRFFQSCMWRRKQTYCIHQWREAGAICDGGFVNLSTVENRALHCFGFCWWWRRKQIVLLFQFWNYTDKAFLYEFDSQY